MAGFQYCKADSANAVSQGWFFIDVSSGPTSTLVVADWDQNFNQAFPVSTVFTEYLTGRLYVTLDFYDTLNAFVGTVWLQLASESSYATDVTSYNLIDYTLGSQLLNAEEGSIFYLNLRFEILPSLQPPGPTGSTGPTGIEGPTGATGPVIASLPSAGLLATTTDQSVPNSTLTVVDLDTESLAATSSDLTTNPLLSTITVNTSGRYQITGSCNWTSSPPPGTYTLSVQVNGATVKSTRQSVPALVPTTGGAVGTDLSQSITVILDMTATQVVRLAVSQDSGGAVSLSGADTSVSSELAIQRLS